MKSAVIVFPGSNCDRDAVDALQKIGSKVSKIWHQETTIDNDLDLIIVPGGFSYGDYLRSGAMAAISPVMLEVKRLAEKGVKVLGICNGFQILTEAGLLDGVLLRNKKVKFSCRNVLLSVEDSGTAFTNKYKKGQIIKVPIAHMDGNYFADPAVLKKLEDNGNIAFRYVDENGNVTDDANPNGSALNIAGIFNDNKNILGMMPHPERAVDINTGSSDGLLLFQSLLNLS
ncbi:MAG: phosphoribosylformylglycinamidine synthase subunit PurQ [Rickettsiales bacterium]|nr:phosphoribosylformylglycinamidine synthase subunit PurQ [Rickettsiales bacterium]